MNATSLTKYTRSNKTGLEIKNLTINNLKQYQESILSSETIFHPELREDLDEIVDILKTKGAIGKVAYLNDKYVGNALGASPTVKQIDEMKLLGIGHSPRSIYLFNFVVDSKFQKQGIGTKLLINLIEDARKKGYDILEGHFRNGNSLHVAKKLGAKEIKIYPNWFNTGESYTHCEIELK